MSSRVQSSFCLCFGRGPPLNVKIFLLTPGFLRGVVFLFLFLNRERVLHFVKCFFGVY